MANQGRLEILSLPDGRKLAYTEFGVAYGFPVLYFHGAPSSRLEPLLISDDVFARLNLRLISLDRPGIGGSDFQPNRGFSDWAQDVLALADALGLLKFSILGNSGGGGYAAVCAARIPERLQNVVIVSGGWRMNQPEAMKNLPFRNRLVFMIADKAPFLLKPILNMMAAPSQGEPEQQLSQLKPTLHPADYAIFQQPGKLEALNQAIQEAMRQGTKGAEWDLRLYVREWDFRLDEIQIPLKLFHGEEDQNAPIALVRKMVAQIPNAQLTTFKHEAHLSTFHNHIDELAQALVD